MRRVSPSSAVVLTRIAVECRLLAWRFAAFVAVETPAGNPTHFFAATARARAAEARAVLMGNF
jgi:hypothetical protein